MTAARQEETTGNQEMLENITQEVILGTREGKLHWKKSSSPSGGQYAMTIQNGPRTWAAIVEIQKAGKESTVSMKIQRGGEVITWTPQAQGELLQIVQRLEEAEHERQRDSLPPAVLAALREIRYGDEADGWTIQRTIGGYSDDGTEVQLDTAIHFGQTGRAPVDREFWEYALDHFLQTGDLNDFVQNSGYWYSRDDHLLSGTEFEFDISNPGPGMDGSVIPGEAIRRLARENDRGEMDTYTGKEDVISTVKLQMRFLDPQAAQPVLDHIRGDT